MALLANQLSINEKIVNWEKIDKGTFFFLNSIVESINGSDWALEENKDEVKSWCEKYMLKYEYVEPQLQRVWQSKLVDFNEN